MPKPRLQHEYNQLEGDIVDTLLAGLKEWRSDLSYPESYSDMQGCVRALLRMFEIKRRPIALAVLPLHCDFCHGTGTVMTLVDGKPEHLHGIPCPRCSKEARR